MHLTFPTSGPTFSTSRWILLQHSSISWGGGGGGGKVSGCVCVEREREGERERESESEYEEVVGSWKRRREKKLSLSS